VRSITVTDEIKRYIVELVETTRAHGEIYLGASPRGSLALFRTSQARAAILGREYVLPDDVKALAVPALAHRLIVGSAARIKALAVPALAHRLIVGSAARIREVDAVDVIEEVLEKVPVPGGEVG